MFRRGEERNYGVLIASIVAIVAIVGMVVYFSGSSVGGAAVMTYNGVGAQAATYCYTQAQLGNEWGRCIGSACADLCMNTGVDSSECARKCVSAAQYAVRSTTNSFVQ